MSLMRRRLSSDWPLETLWNQELVDGMFGDMLRNFFTGESAFDRAAEGGSHPMRVEEYIEGDTCVIRAELPGIDPENDVEITVADGVLHFRAERRERTDEERPHGYRSEFHYGSLARSIRLPEGASEADVKASYKDGILEVRVPAPVEPVATTPKRIPINRS